MTQPLLCDAALALEPHLRVAVLRRGVGAQRISPQDLQQMLALNDPAELTDARALTIRCAPPLEVLMDTLPPAVAGKTLWDTIGAALCSHTKPGLFGLMVTCPQTFVYSLQRLPQGAQLGEPDLWQLASLHALRLSDGVLAARILDAATFSDENPGAAELLRTMLHKAAPALWQGTVGMWFAVTRDRLPECRAYFDEIASRYFVTIRSRQDALDLHRLQRSPQALLPLLHTLRWTYESCEDQDFCRLLREQAERSGMQRARLLLASGEYLWQTEGVLHEAALFCQQHPDDGNILAERLLLAQCAGAAANEAAQEALQAWWLHNPRGSPLECLLRTALLLAGAEDEVRLRLEML